MEGKPSQQHENRVSIDHFVTFQEDTLSTLRSMKFEEVPRYSMSQTDINFRLGQMTESLLNICLDQRDEIDRLRKRIEHLENFLVID
jgi:hypothetical protein